MGPGPGNPYPEVALGFARPLLGHLDPEFLAVLDETNDRLREVWKTSNRLTFPVSGTGSAGMEISFVNVVRPGSVVVVGVNGVFGGRMCDVAARAGAEVVRVDFEWGQPVDPDRLVEAHPSPDVIALVHAETSTGVRSDVAAVAERKGDALLIADCVTSLGGIPVAIDEWGVDIAYSGTQKCLGVPPGLAPFTINERALERLIPIPQSWYLDLNLIAGYVGSDSGRSYHHTAPISMIQGLHAGLGALLDEGLEASWERHQRVGDLLKEGLLKRGFELFAAEGYRLPELTTAVVPGSIDEADVRRRLLNEYDIEIGGGLGPVAGKVWRIGTMGHTARASNVEMFLAALDALM
jgi:alanine-glyoxylate transaminase/serine-glyoxylate transaminase/serine-pyruvate transaminase